MAGDEALRTPEEQSESNVIDSSLQVPLDELETAANTSNSVPTHCPLSLYRLMRFKEAVVSNAKKINLTSLYILLFICNTIVLHLAKELSSQFLLKLDSYVATQAPLSLAEAFQKFHIEIAYEMAIMLVFLLALLLSCPRPLFVVVVVTISFVGLFLYIPDLMNKAPENVVTCGFFMVPLVWFTTLAALVLSLIFVCLALFFAYLIYGCASGTRGSMGELEVDMEDFQIDV